MVGPSELQFGDHIESDSVGAGGSSSNVGDIVITEGADGAGGVAGCGSGASLAWSSKRSFVEVSTHR